MTPPDSHKPETVQRHIAEPGFFRPHGNQSPLVYLMMENDLPQTEQLNQSLLANGYRVQIFTSPVKFDFSCDAPGKNAPAAIIMNMVCPETNPTGAAFLSKFKSRNTCCRIIFISEHDDIVTRLNAFRAGACHYLVKPVETERLLDLLDEVTGRVPAAPYRVLMVDDEQLFLGLHAAILRSAGMTVHTLSQPLKILDAVGTFNPDVVVLDVHMPDATGPELAAVLRQYDAHQQLPILFLSAETDTALQLLALNLGGDDFLVKPVEPNHLIAAVTARAQRARQSNAIGKRLQTMLYEREREHLAVNHHAIISIADQAGNITYINDQFCQASGYSPNELLGQNHRIINSGEHSSGFYQALWNTISSGQVWQGEICNRRKDGSLYWVASTITPFLDAEGKPYQYVSIRTDITQVKASEAALRESKERLNQAQQVAQLGSFDWSPVTGELNWSDEHYRLLGLEPGSVTPSYALFRQGIHADDLNKLDMALQKAMDNKKLFDVMYRFTPPNGSEHILHSLGEFVFDETGKAIRLVGTVQDVTERMRAERALQESQTKLSGLFELSPLGIVLTDMQGHYLEFNEAFRSICGYPADELKQLDYWALTPREYEQQERAQLECINKTGRYGPYEKVYRQKNGGLVPIRLNGMVVRDQAGQSRIWSIVEDITDSKRTEETLIAARDEANRASRAKSEFLSSMSHELRTPMNAILGFSQLMEYDPALTNEHKDNVQEIIRAGQHLLSLINEVLDLSRIESGHIDMSLEPVELCPVINDCLTLLSALADKHHIKISHHRLAGAVVRADQMRLKQALLNLISNAIKYNRDGGRIHIEVQQTAENYLRILVTDTGLGIPANLLDSLFQPFNRLGAESSDIEGTGIGLTITRRIVEMMGGSVGVESEAGVGSTFWIELPLEFLPDSTDHEPASPEPVALAPSADTAQHIVLYIEDNPANLKLVAQILGMRPHIHLLTAHTPQLGIELALTRRPELILLDINMPDMNGYQVLQRFKSEASLKAIPVVAVTADAMPREIARGKAAGFTDYLVKPLNIPQFQAVIDKLLNTAGKQPA